MGKLALHDVETQVLSNVIDSCELSLERPTYMLLMVSGGSDSVALLHIMRRIRDSMGPLLSLGVVNFNHKLRQESEIEVNILS